MCYIESPPKNSQIDFLVLFQREVLRNPENQLVRVFVNQMLFLGGHLANLRIFANSCDFIWEFKGARFHLGV